MRGGETEEFDQYRDEIENFLNLGSDGEKYVINENEENEMSFSIISTNFTPDICRKVEFENIRYIQIFKACKRGDLVISAFRVATLLFITFSAYASNIDFDLYLTNPDQSKSYTSLIMKLFLWRAIFKSKSILKKMD